jgi:uncharacterized NAD(P)/FAD-binding protein YdhS
MRMPEKASLKKIAIIGGGPAALYLLKEFSAKDPRHYTIDIFEAGERLGCGMPYSKAGANPEHIANVSGNEIPELITPLTHWTEKLPASTLNQFGVKKNQFDEYEVVPRLLLGQYLENQFDQLLDIAAKKGIRINTHLSTQVIDIIDQPEINRVLVKMVDNEELEFDIVIICTGHSWPRKEEGKVKDYFDSPYPPQKLMHQCNHPVAIKGSSLTAIDAVVTLAIVHGRFERNHSMELTWIANENAPEFKMVMHSLQGLLPAIRIYLNDPQLKSEILLSEDDIFRHIMENDGFLSLDYLFEKNFKEPMKARDREYYQQIRNMSLEEFVKNIMETRKQADAFQLFKAEYREANRSILLEKPVYWKELLAALNHLINYPAKHLSAEDMIRFQKLLMPLIAIIIAFVPQESCEQLIALYDAGRLEIISVDESSRIETCKEGGIIYHYKDEAGKEHHQRYHTYIDCTGQPPLSLEQFPFQRLKESSLSPARIKFRSPEEGMKEKKKGNKEVEADDKNWYLHVPGIAITDSFAPINKEGQVNPRIYMLASPFISGFNPDFSGLDVCSTAAKIVTEDILS